MFIYYNIKTINVVVFFFLNFIWDAILLCMFLVNARYIWQYSLFNYL